MMPVGPLMVEHRLIERWVTLLEPQGQQMEAEFLIASVDFLQTYADRIHHGKEEDILFHFLSEKALSTEHRRTMEDLIEEHVRMRGFVASLAHAGPRGEGWAALQVLPQLYRAHIAKEDKQFFLPAMTYLTPEEQAQVLDQFREFDRRMIHEKCKAAVGAWEARAPQWAKHSRS